MISGFENGSRVSMTWRRRGRLVVWLATMAGVAALTVNPGALAAAGSATSVTVPTGTLTGPVTVGSDANASTGKYIQFNVSGALFNVQSYGATGNGSTDDRAAIQAAINAAGQATPAGVVVFPAGTYNISGILSLAPNVELLGYGSQASIVRATTNSTGGLYLASGNRIRGLDLRGANAGINCSAPINGIDGGGGGSNLVESSSVDGWGCMGIHTGLSRTNDIISNNTIHDNGDDALLFDVGSDNNFAESNEIYNNQKNSVDINSNGNYVRFNNLHNNGLLCISTTWQSDCTGITIFRQGTGGTANSNVIESNTISSNSYTGIFFNPGSGASADNNIVSNNSITNNGYMGLWIRNTSSTGSAKNNKFVGNTLTGNKPWGVFIDSSASNTYANNTITSSGPNDGIITYHQFPNSPDSNTFSGNNIFANQAFGINISTGSNNSISSNYIYSNTKGSINNTGSGTVISGNLSSAPTSPLPAGPVSTACPTYPTDKGTATVSVNVPATGNYVLWSRLMPTAANANSFYVQVDTTCPVIVGNQSNLPTGTWDWVNFRFTNGTATQTMVYPLTAGSHTLKLIGRQAGVKLDELLLTTDSSCIPTGTGANCASSLATATPTPITTATATPIPSATATPKPTSTPASVSVALPNAPSNLTATNARHKGLINLVWTDNSTNESGFLVERSRDLVNFAQIASVGANTTRYTDTGLASTTTYYYRVRAFDSAGNSSYSNVASAVAR